MYFRVTCFCFQKCFCSQILFCNSSHCEIDLSLAEDYYYDDDTISIKSGGGGGVPRSIIIAGIIVVCFGVALVMVIVILGYRVNKEEKEKMALEESARHDPLRDDTIGLGMGEREIL